MLHCTSIYTSLNCTISQSSIIFICIIFHFTYHRTLNSMYDIMQFNITSQYCHLSIKLYTWNHYVHVQSFTSTSPAPQNYTCTPVQLTLTSVIMFIVITSMQLFTTTIKYTFPSFLLLCAHNKIIITSTTDLKFRSCPVLRGIKARVIAFSHKKQFFQ